MASVDGLVSGLNTSDIIKQLMQLERQPQVRLQTKQASVESAISALRNLNTKFMAIKTAAEKMTVGTGWQLATATTTDATRVSATAVAGAPQGSMTFTVDRLAAASAYLTSGHVTDRTAPGSVATANSSIWITKGAAGTPVEVPTGDGSLNAVVSAINKSGAGVSASVIQLTSGEYKLQLASTTTGADTAIKVEETVGGPAALTSMGTMDLKVPGQDAQLTVLGQVVTRASNTVSDLLQGVTLTLAKADPATEVTVAVKSDTEALASQVQGLVDAVNAARSDIKALTTYNLETKAKGKLYGDHAVRSLNDRLGTAVVGDGTTSAGIAGVSVARDGTVTFDKTKFLKALADDPVSVEKTLGAGGVAGRLQALADGVSRSKTAEGGPGLIAGSISSREGQVTSLRANIKSWDNRLELRERTLMRQYAALETALGASQQQGQWLAGQIAGLPSWGG